MNTLEGCFPTEKFPNIEQLRETIDEIKWLETSGNPKAVAWWVKQQKKEEELYRASNFLSLEDLLTPFAPLVFPLAQGYLGLI